MSIIEKRQEFLSENHLDINEIDSEKILNEFLKEIERGLQGHSDSSLKMLPSYLEVKSDFPSNQSIIVLDAGGTNLRVCLLSFSESGKAEVEYFKKYAMPGIKEELSETEFYDLICQYLRPIIDQANSIGFCFSYPSEINEQKSAKLLYWAKEVKVPELVGKDIDVGLKNALAERGFSDKKIIMLNDTVATLMAGIVVGSSRKCESYIGFILGTGLNIAYTEKNNLIPKIDLNEGSQCINAESGNYAQYPQNEIDKKYDQKTENPGTYTFEKMISGRYLGELGFEHLVAAVKKGIFSDSAKEAILMTPSLTTKEISQFLENPHHSEAPFTTAEISEEDRETIYTILTALINRAAKLAAIKIASFTVQSQAGHSPLHPVCINIDGSTYHKLFGFSTKVESFLNEILTPKNIHYITIEVDNAPILGSAIAGLQA